MTTQIKSLMFVAAVAILPAACGTSGSPTGMEVAAIELDAQRREATDPVPPQAPTPTDPGSIPVPDVKPAETAPDPTSVPLPADRPNRPRPPVTTPVATPSEPSPLPPSPEGSECVAASIEIVFEGAYLVGYPAGDRYRATVLDTFGFAITDQSCEKLAWEAHGAATGSVITVTPEGTRYATVKGDGNPYKLIVTAPNGVSGSTVLGGAAR